MSRGTANHVLLKLFRRFLGCTGVHVATKAKLWQVQFIRSYQTDVNAATHPVDTSCFGLNQFSDWNKPFQ